MSNTKLISTSALAKKLSMHKYKLDELLLAAKYVRLLAKLNFQHSFLYQN